MTHLLAHVESRGGLDSGMRLLRYATGKPITARRYDYLWDRLGEHLPWVKTQQVTTHWIRHTILTWVERRFGFAVATSPPEHHGRRRQARTRHVRLTGTHVRAGLPEVATALCVLTGEPHPLAPEGAAARADGSRNRLMTGIAQHRYGELPRRRSAARPPASAPSPAWRRERRPPAPPATP